MRSRKGIERACCLAQSQPGPPPGLLSIAPTDAGFWQVNGSSAFGGNQVSTEFGFKVEASGSERVSGWSRYDIPGVQQGATINWAQFAVQDALNHPLAPPGTAMYTGAAVGIGNVPLGQHFARCDIFGEDADTAGFYNTPAGYNGAPRTTANTPYNQWFNNVDGTDPNVVYQYFPLAQYTIAVITPIMQEIVNRPGWLPFQPMQFFWDENASDGANSVWGAYADLSMAAALQVGEGPFLQIAWTNPP